MPDITITLSDADYKAFEVVANTPEDWVQNAAQERARKAGDEIVKNYTTRALSEGVQIPLTRDEVILDAYARGWVQSSADASAAYTAQLIAAKEAEATPE